MAKESQGILCKLHNLMVMMIYINVYICKNIGACDVMVIVVGNGHGDSSSNPGRD